MCTAPVVTRKHVYLMSSSLWALYCRIKELQWQIGLVPGSLNAKFPTASLRPWESLKALQQRTATEFPSTTIAIYMFPICFTFRFVATHAGKYRSQVNPALAPTTVKWDACRSSHYGYGYSSPPINPMVYLPPIIMQIVTNKENYWALGNYRKNLRLGHFKFAVVCWCWWWWW